MVAKWSRNDDHGHSAWRTRNVSQGTAGTQITGGLRRRLLWSADTIRAGDDYTASEILQRPRSLCLCTKCVCSNRYFTCFLRGSSACIHIRTSTRWACFLAQERNNENHFRFKGLKTRGGQIEHGSNEKIYRYPMNIQTVANSNHQQLWRQISLVGTYKFNIGRLHDLREVYKVPSESSLSIKRRVLKLHPWAEVDIVDKHSRCINRSISSEIHGDLQKIEPNF